jgi:5-methyltetrahydropteroyltriglutamate--homocysteine methyltransferase
MTPVWRAEHIGSFLRPSELLQARSDEVAPGALHEIVDAQIRRILAKQAELGFEIFTDGEFRRRNFMSDFTDAVEGFDLDDAVDRPWEATQGDAPVSRVAGVVTAKLKKLRPFTLHELHFLQKNSPGAIKMTLPSATQFPAIAFKRGVTDKVYANYSELLSEIAEIVRQEMQMLAQQGVNYIQIDAPRYSYYLDPKWRQWMQQEMGLDPEKTLEEALQADNLGFRAARAPGVTLGIHLCRGNNRSHWYAEGGYDAIAEKLFSTLEVDRFLLEYDDERSGTFGPLRFVPRGKKVVLGLVSSKQPELEDGKELVRKIEEAAKYVPLEDLALSPQCGFASTMEGNLLTEAQQWDKLRLVAETARQVWGTS